MEFDVYFNRATGRRVLRPKGTSKRSAQRGRRRKPSPGVRSMRRWPGASHTWLDHAINASVASGDIAVGLTDGMEIVLTNNSAIKHIYRNKQAFLAAIYAAVQGNQDKPVGASVDNVLGMVRSGVTLARAAVNNTPVAAAAATLGVPIIGVRARFTGSATNNDYRPFSVDIGRIQALAGVLTIPSPIASFIVYTRTPTADAVFWIPTPGPGRFALGPGISNSGVPDGTTTTNPGILVQALTATTAVEFEGINMRDVYPHFGPCPPASGAHDDASVSDEDWLDDADELDLELDSRQPIVPDNWQGWRANNAHSVLRDE
jgi:hypothetical protein